MEQARKFIENTGRGGGPKMKRAIGLMALMAVLVIGIAYATCTVTDLSYLHHGDLIQVNYTGWADNTSIQKANISISGCGTLDQENTSLEENNTLGVFNFSISEADISSGLLRDDTQCTITAKIYNVSAASVYIEAASSTCTAETFYIDYTVPICIHSQSSRETYNPKQTWTVTGTNASSATIKFGANAPFAMTESTAGDVFTYTGHIPESTYDPVRATTTDGLNTTICDLNYVRIDAKSTIKQVGVGVASAAAAKLARPDNNLLIIAIIGIVVFWYMKKSK